MIQRYVSDTRPKDDDDELTETTLRILPSCKQKCRASTRTPFAAWARTQKLIWDFHIWLACFLPTQYTTGRIGIFQHLRPTRSRLVRSSRGLVIERAMTSVEALLAHRVLRSMRVGV